MQCDDDATRVQFSSRFFSSSFLCFLVPDAIRLSNIPYIFTVSRMCVDGKEDDGGDDHDDDDDDVSQCMRTSTERQTISLEYRTHTHTHSVRIQLSKNFSLFFSRLSFSSFSFGIVLLFASVVGITLRISLPLFHVSHTSSYQ